MVLPSLTIHVAFDTRYLEQRIQVFMTQLPSEAMGVIRWGHGLPISGSIRLMFTSLDLGLFSTL